MTKTDSNIRDSYKLYKKICENIIDIKNYIYISNDYNKFLIEKLLTGDQITLPGKMGTLMITGKKIKITFNEQGQPNLAPDWVKTKELWDRNPEAKAQRKKLYHTNEHTNGVIYSAVWGKNKIAIENKRLYSLQLVRTNKRLIHSAIKKGVEFFIRK
jgi:hypothetical protein